MGKREKWDIFKFSDLDKISPIFQFYGPAMDITINIAIDLCTFSTAQNKQNITPTPIKT